VPEGAGGTAPASRSSAARRRAARRVLADLNKKLKKGKKVHEKSRTQCGPPTKSKIVMFDRVKAPVGEGLRSTSRPSSRSGTRAPPPRRFTGKDVEARHGLAAYAVAGAAFHIAEVQYEDFLRIKFPEGLDFQQPSQYDTKKKAEAKKKKSEESGKKFSAYLDSKAKQLDKARNQYLEVFAMKQAQWTIASAARVGQIY
jgi:hypothetical protein